MKKIWMWILWAGLVSLGTANAMTLQVVDTQVFATGPIGGDDYLQFKAVFDNPRINTLVLVNSLGGDLWAGLAVARMVADKGYRTVTVGSCMSACSLLFMAGKQRRFGDALRPNFNVIGVHGAHNSLTQQVDPTLQPQLYAFYKNAMGSAFQEKIIEQALYDMTDLGGMLRIPEITRAKEARVVHCRGRQTPTKQCTQYPEQNGVRLGVLTDDTLQQITLPVSMQEVPMVLGKPLDQMFISLHAHLKETADRQCLREQCKEQMQKWIDLSQHKAIATRTQGPGVAWIDNSPSAMRSFVQALYRCNHARDESVGLCRVESVNGYDVRGLYAQAEREHATALEALRIPLERYYGNEEFGGGWTQAKGYRLSHVHDITPQSLPGIRTIGTQDLAKALLAAQPPVVIDVWAGVNEALPTAQSLVNGGLAFDRADAESGYQLRFTALLNLLAPDKDRPVVFYCASRDCWLSVNAALRAQAAGYTQVLWYRGGYTAWKAAGLPTALVQIQAIAH